MNRNNNIFNKNEVENKLKDFKEGTDYSISPTDEPNIKTYNFHNDKLRSMFRDDRVPVRITREAYDGKDYTYRGHFEEGKDYRYSRQEWQFGENYQGNRGTDIFGNNEWMDDIKWDEHYRESSPDKWEVGWVYRGKNSRNSLIGRRIEPEKIESTHDLKWKHNQLKDKLNSLLARPESDFGVNGKEKKECEIAEVKKDIAAIERAIEKEKNHAEISHQSDWIKCPVCDKTFNKDAEIWGVQDEAGFQPTCCRGCAEIYKDKRKPYGRVIKSGSDEYYRRDLQQKGRMGRGEKGSWVDKSNLEKENQELRQKLAEVQKQLAEVLEELKKLKSNVNGKGSEKLEQQILHNEKLIKNSENVSVAEVKEQVQKSQALMNELNTSVSTDNKGNGSLPYVIGGSVILAAAGIISYLLVRKNKRK